jgi:hypothetical protein
MASIHASLQDWLGAKRNGKEDDEAERMRQLEATITDQSAAAITRLLSPQELQTPFGMAVIRHWTHADPVQASEWVAARPAVTEDETFAVAQGWTANIAGLQAYLDSSPDTPWKQNLIRQAASQVSGTDPVAAIGILQRMDPGIGQINLLQSVVSNWVNSDPETASTWIMQVDDPALRESLIATAAKTYALTDPAQAAAWLVSNVTSEGVVKDAVLNVTQSWVTKDPAAAAAWVTGFPEGNTKVAAIDIVSSYWRQTDPGAETAWIEQVAQENQSKPN